MDFHVDKDASIFLELYTPGILYYAQVSAEVAERVFCRACVLNTNQIDGRFSDLVPKWNQNIRQSSFFY
jgi:hypothetical protein